MKILILLFFVLQFDLLTHAQGVFVANDRNHPIPVYVPNFSGAVPVTIARNNEFPVLVTTQAAIDAKMSLFEQFASAQKTQSKETWSASFEELTYTNQSDTNYTVSVQPLIAFRIDGGISNTVVAGVYFNGDYNAKPSYNGWSARKLIDDRELETIRTTLVTILNHTNINQTTAWRVSVNIRDSELSISEPIVKQPERANIEFGNRNLIRLNDTDLQQFIDFLAGAQTELEKRKLEAKNFKP